MKIVNVVYDESDIINQSIKEYVDGFLKFIYSNESTKLSYKEHIDGSTIATIVTNNVCINFLHESLWIVDEQYADKTYGTNLVTFRRDYDTMLEIINSKIN